MVFDPDLSIVREGDREYEVSGAAYRKYILSLPTGGTREEYAAARREWLKINGKPLKEGRTNG